jgi:hypothetical protein
VFVPVVRQDIMLEVHVERSCSPHGSLEAKRGKKGAGSQHPFPGHATMTPLPALGSTLYKGSTAYLPTVPQAGD